MATSYLNPTTHITAKNPIEVGAAALYSITGDTTQVCELNSSEPSEIAQTINGDFAGDTLHLTFQDALRGGTSDSENNIEVLWNGVGVANYKPTTNAMMTQTLSLVGQAGVNTLSFASYSVQSSEGGIIDNVSLTAPSPAAFLPMAFGLLPILRLRRRSKK
jgi:hypothetical protein